MRESVRVFLEKQIYFCFFLVQVGSVSVRVNCDAKRATVGTTVSFNCGEGASACALCVIKRGVFREKNDRDGLGLSGFHSVEPDSESLHCISVIVFHIPKMTEN